MTNIYEEEFIITFNYYTGLWLLNGVAFSPKLLLIDWSTYKEDRGQEHVFCIRSVSTSEGLIVTDTVYLGNLLKRFVEQHEHSPFSPDREFMLTSRKANIPTPKSSFMYATERLYARALYHVPVIE